jgi:hypothetical protein
VGPCTVFSWSIPSIILRAMNKFFDETSERIGILAQILRAGPSHVGDGGLLTGGLFLRVLMVSTCVQPLCSNFMTKSRACMLDYDRAERAV